MEVGVTGQNMERAQRYVEGEYTIGPEHVITRLQHMVELIVPDPAQTMHHATRKIVQVSLILISIQ
jgi:hypothetical protein